MDKLVSEGLLYMNTAEYFARLDGESVRADANEGVAFLHQPDRIRIGFKVNMEDDYQWITGLAGPVISRTRECFSANVYCMYGLRASVAKSLVDPRNFAFGDTFVLFKEGDEFIRRAKKAALASGREMLCHMVEYIDEASYSGEMGPFRKYSAFSYQNEVRLGLRPGTGAPYELRLGNLSDIVAVVGPLAEINSRVRIVNESDPEQMPLAEP